MKLRNITNTPPLPLPYVVDKNQPIEMCLKLLNMPLIEMSDAKCIFDAGASTTNIVNSIFIMENLDSGGFETLETPNIFLFLSILSLVIILIWSCFILERFVLQVKIVVALFNLESLFC